MCANVCMYVCYLKEKCLFMRMQSFDLINITAIIPECDHLIVCILVVWLSTVIGKDDNLRKFEDKNQSTQNYQIKLLFAGTISQ